MLENLIYLRETKGLKQKDMARILGISQSTYAKWETKDIIIPLKHLNSLANYFQTSMDYIMGLSRVCNKTKEIKKLDLTVIATRLKNLRKSYNLSIRELSKEINASFSAMASYERCEHLIITSFLYNICLKYQVSLDYLCGRKEEKKILEKA